MLRGAAPNLSQARQPFGKIEKIEGIEPANGREIAVDRDRELIQVPPKSVRKDRAPENVERYPRHFRLHVDDEPFAQTQPTGDKFFRRGGGGAREGTYRLGRKQWRERAP